jgi:hypothetical protein
VFFKDEREPDVVADDLHRAIDEEPRARVFPLAIIAVFLQFVITSSLAERAGKLHVRSKIRLDRRHADCGSRSIHIANNLPIDPARSVMTLPA